jgi:polygalacturonase
MGKDYETRFRESGKGVAGYADFGALGDGKTDDTPALTRAHTYANKQGLPVAADSGRPMDDTTTK